MVGNIKISYHIISLVIIIVIILNSSIITAAEEETSTSNYFDKGFRYNIQGWVYIHIEGEPYDRGYQYGYLTYGEIIDTLHRWIDWAVNAKIMNLFEIKDIEKIWNLYKSRAMKQFYNKVPEEFIEEIKGITDGLKDRNGKINGKQIEFEDVFTSQFVQDIYYSNFKYLRKSFHPLRSLFYGIMKIFSNNIINHELGHCNAFIATGDATEDGGIVISQATIFNKYIAERCNIVLDVQPSSGYRFMMTCPPGSIWSQEDWYQNEKGIVLTETELQPQGPWKINGIPKGVRSRTAIQYSDSIDEVIEHLQKNNNGLIPNEWLIGDTKTGEIASLQQGLFNTPIKRTFNGFYWSCLVSHDTKLLSELTGVPSLILKICSRIIPDRLPFTIDGENVTWKSNIAQKLEELGNKFYGMIDLEIAKDIMSTYPITDFTTDCKITTSNLMENCGLISFMGITNGSIWKPSDDMKDKYPRITDLPSSGWVTIHPSSSNFIDIDGEKQDNYYQEEDIIYQGSWDGKLKAIYKENNSTKWMYQTGWGVVTKPCVDNDFVYFGSLDNNFYSVDKKNGRAKWVFNCKSAIHSSPTIYGEYVFFGCDDGYLYAINKTNGRYAWSFSPGYHLEEDDFNNYLTTPITEDPYVNDDQIHIVVNGEEYVLDPQTTEDYFSSSNMLVVKKNSIVNSTSIIFGVVIASFVFLTVFCRKWRK